MTADTTPSHATRQAAELFTLPLGRASHPASGNRPGQSTGSSIDFQDHRSYLPGDDPRHIDWSAYARTGHYFMKLYRAEVRPMVDLVVDSSASMTFPADKAVRSAELLAFCVEASLRAGASLRVHAVGAGGVSPIVHEDALRGFPKCAPCGSAPDLEAVPWRAGSLRVWLSDLLYPRSPVPVIGRLLAGNGSGVILAPHSPHESSPDWLGNIELVDSESRARAHHHFREHDMARYQDAYARHFASWSAESRKWAVPLGRVPSSGPLVTALTAHALPVGAVVFAR